MKTYRQKDVCTSVSKSDKHYKEDKKVNSMFILFSDYPFFTEALKDINSISMSYIRRQFIFYISDFSSDMGNTMINSLSCITIINFIAILVCEHVRQINYT